MRILYVSNTRFPTEKAHGHQIAQVCSALAAFGHDVELVTPTVRTPIMVSPFRYYGVPENFRWVKLPNFDALNAFFVPNPIAFAVAMWSYRRHLRSFLRSHGADILYCRSHAVLPSLLETGKPIVLELHTLPQWNRRSFVRACNRCARVVCLTTAMRDVLVGWGTDQNRVIAEGDAVNLSRFTSFPSQKEARKAFDHLPLDRVVVGYVGSFVTRNNIEKGVDILVDAIAKLRGEGRDICGFVVGGPCAWLDRYTKQAQRLGIDEHMYCTGHVAASMVPTAIAACDICVFPAPASAHPYFVRDTSPLKIFEYMAAKKPIVAADLPPLRDVLDESTAFFCKAGDAPDMARALRYVIEHPDEARQRAANALARVEAHTWENRMRRIIAAAFPVPSRTIP